MKYIIGLDIGITSIGWAIVEVTQEGKPFRIIELNSRVFPAAEHPKTGESLAKPRRLSRGARRRNRRHCHRLERIKHLIISGGILTKPELDNLYNGKVPNIYETRVCALDEIISKEDFARLLIHYAQRRGFKSNRKADSKSKESGALLTAIDNNKKSIDEAGYRTVGEMLLKDARFSESKRNKKNNYINTVSRDMVEYEVRKVFEAQRSLGSSFADSETEDKYLNILLSQRSFAKGPGCGPYSGNQIEKMIGISTLDNEPRAPKASYSFEYFSLLQQVNNLRYTVDGEEKYLTQEQRQVIIEFAHEKSEITYKMIREKLNLPDEARFKAIKYKNFNDTSEEKKTKFRVMARYHDMRNALDKISKGYIQNISTEKLNSAAYALTVYKTDVDIKPHLKKNGWSDIEIDALLEIDGFSKFGHLSVKACDNIIPFLENGAAYSEACEKAGYNFKGHDAISKAKLLPAKAPELGDITNPVARRAIAQTIKVVNAIIRKYGSPIRINVELARDMSHNLEERRKKQAENNKNREKNDEAMDYIKKELNRFQPTGQDLIKYKLWKEQDGICPYCQKELKLDELFSSHGYCDIDHIYPYSISFDDSFNNKVLVHSNENRDKGNRLPLQYLAGTRKDNFIVWVNNNVHNNKKRDLLLKRNMNDADSEGFIERNLNDTRYISRFMYNYINDYLLFDESESKRKVYAVNGAVTAYMRKRWGIQKIREDGDLHHAVDAAVVACITDGMIKRVSKYSKDRETKYMVTEDGSHVIRKDTGEVIDKFPEPWHQFRLELEARVSNDARATLKRLNPINYTPEQIEEVKSPFVSRMPCHKITGSAHYETITGKKRLDSSGYAVVTARTPLTNLKLDKKSGEIENYYNPDSDRLLYEALKKRLLEYGGNGKDAFAANTPPMYKPKANGENGPEVKSVKLIQKMNIVAEVHGGNGTAKNESMIRVDVFYVEGEGYYLVPIYVSDTVKSSLPNKAITEGKSYDSWKTVDESSFIFSLYKNDIIKVCFDAPKKFMVVNDKSSLPKKKEYKEAFGYYNGTDISTGTIKVITHDNTYSIRSRVKKLPSIEKYTVDVLGNISKVNKERRETFEKRKR